MKFIKEMSSKEIQKIVETLEQDGFKKIQKLPASISFELEYRTYQLISTNLNDDEDMGLRLDFKFDEFMNNAKTLDNKKAYSPKPRLTTTLNGSDMNPESFEERLEKLGWEIVQVLNLNSPNSEWKAGLHGDIIYEIKIGNTPHVIIKGQVFEGQLSPLLTMGSQTVEELLAGKRIYSLLKELNY